MIEKILDPLFAPFREAWAKFMGVRNLADNARNDCRRVKRMAKRARIAPPKPRTRSPGAQGGQGAADKAQAAAGQAQGALWASGWGGSKAQGAMPAFGGARQASASRAPGQPPGRG